MNNDHKDLLTQRINDQIIQQWHDVIAKQPKIEYYIKNIANMRNIWLECNAENT